MKSPVQRPVNRIAVLFSRLSGYMASCLQHLKESADVELLVYRWAPATDAPFDDDIFAWIDRLLIKSDQSADDIARVLEDFSPDALLISGWMDQDYMRVARRFRSRGVPVIAGCDTQWKGTARQQIARVVAPWYLHSAIDVLWVAGERQVQFARQLGFTGRQCWQGIYTCDWPQFATTSDDVAEASPKAFLFVGRYVEVKGIDVLVDAYQKYRTMTPQPWHLICAGSGPLAERLEGIDGIRQIGFVQPGQLPALMREASAFVLPSRREPWGVVLHEAAASGLPLISSTASGASVHLLQDRYNGFLFETGDSEHLADCMLRLSSMSDALRLEMGRRSYELSKQFTPERWVDTLLNGVATLRSANDGA